MIIEINKEIKNKKKEKQKDFMTLAVCWQGNQRRMA